MVLKHVNTFAKSNNTLLDYAGKAFYSNIQNLLNTKRHDKLSNNIDKLAKMMCLMKFQALIMITWIMAFLLVLHVIVMQVMIYC